MNIMKLKKGFTLIELLVVIAIIGILASLIIVSLSGARNKAQDTQAKNKARNVATAAEQYAVDNSGNYYGHTTAVQAIAVSGNVSGAYAAYVTSGTTSTIFDKGTAAAYQYISGTGAACTAVGVIGANATKYSAAISLKNGAEPASTSTGIYDIASASTTVNSCVITGMGTDTKAFGIYGPQ